jgi:hypothetical protein
MPEIGIDADVLLEPAGMQAPARLVRAMVAPFLKVNFGADITMKNDHGGPQQAVDSAAKTATAQTAHPATGVATL